MGSEKEKRRQEDEGGAVVPKKEMAEEIGVDERGGRVTLDAQSWYMVIGVANRDVVE